MTPFSRHLEVCLPRLPCYLALRLLAIHKGRLSFLRLTGLPSSASFTALELTTFLSISSLRRCIVSQGRIPWPGNLSLRLFNLHRPGIWVEEHIGGRSLEFFTSSKRIKSSSVRKPFAVFHANTPRPLKANPGRERMQSKADRRRSSTPCSSFRTRW